MARKTIQFKCTKSVSKNVFLKINKLQIEKFEKFTRSRSMLAYLAQKFSRMVKKMAEKKKVFPLCYLCFLIKIIKLQDVITATAFKVEFCL